MYPDFIKPACYHYWVEWFCSSTYFTLDNVFIGEKKNEKEGEKWTLKCREHISEIYIVHYVARNFLQNHHPESKSQDIYKERN